MVERVYFFLWLRIAIWLCIYFTSFHFLFLYRSHAHTQKQTQTHIYTRMENRLMFLLFIRLIFPFRVEMLWDCFHLCHGKQSHTAQIANRKGAHTHEKRINSKQQSTAFYVWKFM